MPEAIAALGVASLLGDLEHEFGMLNWIAGQTDETSIFVPRPDAPFSRRHGRSPSSMVGKGRDEIAVTPRPRPGLGLHVFGMFIAPILASFVAHHFRVRAGHPLRRKTGGEGGDLRGSKRIKPARSSRFRPAEGRGGSLDRTRPGITRSSACRSLMEHSAGKGANRGSSRGAMAVKPSNHRCQ
jgi:hypothetical protein